MIFKIIQGFNPTQSITVIWRRIQIWLIVDSAPATTSPPPTPLSGAPTSFQVSIRPPTSISSHQTLIGSQISGSHSLSLFNLALQPHDHRSPQHTAQCSHSYTVWKYALWSNSSMSTKLVPCLHLAHMLPNLPNSCTCPSVF